MTPSLEGKRVLVLRPEHQAHELAGMIKASGGEAVTVPVIRILPPEDWSKVDDALRRLDEFDWTVFTSVNGVTSFTGRMQQLDQLAIPTKVAAIGPATARALQAVGTRVDWIPSVYTSVALAESLPGPPSGVLLVRADVAPTELEDILTSRGFQVERLNVYRTEPTGGPGLLQALQEVDGVALTSASIARSFAEAAGAELDNGPAVFSIGPATSAACRRAGIKVNAEAAEHTLPGLVETLVQYFQSLKGGRQNGFTPPRRRDPPTRMR